MQRTRFPQVSPHKPWTHFTIFLPFCLLTDGLSFCRLKNVAAQESSFLDGKLTDVLRGVDYLKHYTASLACVPGVYHMKGAKGRLLYIGKAKNLPKRLLSYTQVSRLPIRLQRMVACIHAVDVIQTRSEAEALLLEAFLIQKHKPPYNIVCKDNKSMVYLRLTSHPFPRLMRHRGTLIKGDTFFGPFPSASSVYMTQKVLHQTFRLRSCSDTVFKNRSRPCLQYHIKRCSAPCVGKITETTYAQDVRDTTRTLKGRLTDVQQDLGKKMHAFSADLRYEEAAAMRNRIQALTALQQKHALTLHTPETRKQLGAVHVLGYACKANWHVLYLLFFDAGRLLGGHPLVWPTDTVIAQEANNPHNTWEPAATLLTQFYHHTPLPRVLLSDAPFLNKTLLQQALHKNEQPFTMRAASSTAEKTALQHAHANAYTTLQQTIQQHANKAELMQQLAAWMQLATPPKRIEVFDNAHLQGTHPYGAMIVAEESTEQRSTNAHISSIKTPFKPAFSKKAYRLFRFTAATNLKTNDDYGMMRQMMTRRFHDAVQDDWPDLIIIDGGKGHLKAVYDALNAQHVNTIPLLAIAKGPARGRLGETFFTWAPATKHTHRTRQAPANPLITQRKLASTSQLYFYLEQLRDEAHRFGNTRHQKAREKSLAKSTLDTLPGIGQVRKKALLAFFGSLQAVKEAPLSQLLMVPGISKKLAQHIRHLLNHKH